MKNLVQVFHALAVLQIIFIHLDKASCDESSNKTEFHHNNNKAETGAENDEVLQEQILALDKFVMGHLTNNKVLPPPKFNQSEFPDMGLFRQMLEIGQDKIKIFGICNACHVGVGYLMFKVRFLKRELTEMVRVANFICEYFKIATSEVCKGTIERYAPVLHFIMKERPAINSRAFCGSMLQSHGCIANDPIFEWNVDIPPAKASSKFSNNQVESRNMNSKGRKQDNTGLIKIVQLTDLHIDPLYEAGANAVCDNNILCCQGSQGRPLDNSLQAGQFGDARRCDTPQHSFEMTLEHIAKEHGDMDLFYMNGDLVPHNVWSTSIEENSRIIEKSAQTILKYFPNTTVIPMIGNHEPHPVNFFSPYGVPEELSTTWVYNVSYEAFKQWIPTDQTDSYKKFGSYFVEINPKFRLLIFNSNLCYEFNLWQMYEPNDPGDQLKWLIQELQVSEDKNQFVHIIGHVPPGHEECFHVWSRNFFEIVKRYHKIIKGQFYGHTHFDEFKIIYKDRKPINVLWIAPSLTPYEVHNLVYRVYYADPIDYSIVDHETWTFDLNKENSNIRNTSITISSSPGWFRSYSLASIYGIPDAKPQSLHTLVEKLARNSQLFQLFHRIYYKSLTSEYKQRNCSIFCKKRLLCGFLRRHTTYHAEDEECTRIHSEIDRGELQ